MTTPPPSPQRRVLTVLSAAQVFSGFGLAAGITVGALLAKEVWGTTAAAGIPAVVMTAGAAGSSLLIARLSNRWGRRGGLTFGYFAGALGASGIVFATWRGVPALLLLAFLIYGAGSAANLQARYAGADLAPKHRKASAMAVILMATTLGAVLGPLIAGTASSWVEEWGLALLTGPFVVAGIAYALGAVVLVSFLRPDPLLTAKAIAHTTPPEPVLSDAGAVPLADAPSAWRVQAAWGIAVMVVVQVVMVSIMTMTPVHMAHHHHTVAAIGVVIAAHVAAMYVPSPLSGWLVDRWGPWPVAASAAGVLAGAGVVSAVAPGTGTWEITTGLVLLGLGWSLGIMAGSALVTVHTPTNVRAKVQGRADALVAMSAASGAGASGVIMQSTSYALLALACAALALALVPAFVVTWRSEAGRLGAS